MSDLCTWIYLGRGGLNFMKHFNGDASYKSLGTSGLYATQESLHLCGSSLGSENGLCSLITRLDTNGLPFFGDLSKEACHCHGTKKHE
jgi:hypothetical protein